MVRILLALFFFASAALKLVSTHDTRFALGVTSYYAVAAFEVVIGSALLLNRVKVGCVLAITFVGGALVYSYWSRGQPCGCTGGVDLPLRMRAIVLASVGALASMLLHLRISRHLGTAG